jgi:hypothetical protein
MCAMSYNIHVIMYIIYVYNSATIQGQQEQAIINAPKVMDFNNAVCHHVTISYDVTHFIILSLPIY